MRKLIMLIAGAVIVLNAAMFMACSKDVQEAVVEVESVELSATLKAGVELVVGQSLEIAADVTILPAKATNQTKNYTSSDITVAMVNANGKITTNGAGTTIIKVIVDKKTDTFTLTVKVPTIDDIRVESVTLSPEVKDGVNLTINKTLNIASSVTFTPANASYPTKTYTSSAPAVATVNAGGGITALSVGTTTITVSVDGKSDSFTLTVDPVRVGSIALDNTLKAGVELGISETLDIAGKVTITPVDATNKAETYTSSSELIATVSTAGVVTAVAKGTSTITMTIDGQSDSFVVTVKEAAPTVTSDVTALKIPVGATNRIWQHITVTPAPSSLKEKPISFASSNNGIASVDQNGVIIGQGAGNATITIEHTSSASIKTTVSVTVVAPTYYERKLVDGATADWTITTANTLTAKQKTEGAFDGVWSDSNKDVDENVFGLSKPSLTVTAANPVEFVVDMKQSQVVNVFKIIHRSGPNTNMPVRYFGFDEISGSNDGVSFTPIATDVEVADAISPLKLSISETTFANTTSYQYIKFSARTPGVSLYKGWADYPGVDKLLNADRSVSTDAAWNSGIITGKKDGAGGSLQLQELYLGFY